MSLLSSKHSQVTTKPVGLAQACHERRDVIQLSKQVTHGDMSIVIEACLAEHKHAILE